MTNPLRSIEPDPAPEEAPPRRQPGARVRVVLETGDPFEVVVDNRDRLKFEKTRARHKEWADYGQSFAMTFVTWSAAQRTGRTGVTFEEWERVLVDWDEVAEEPADPTR